MDAMFNVTAPIPEGWTAEDTARHLQFVLGVWAGGLVSNDVRNVFTGESIKVEVTNAE